MAKNPSPARRQWRPATGQPPRRSLVMANWRRGDAVLAAAANRRLGRSTRLALGLVGVLLCFGLAISVVLWLQPVSPIGLYVIQAGYLKNLAVPPNPEGLHSADALTRLAGPGANDNWQRSWVGGLATTRQVTLDAGRWDEKLNDLPEATILVYLTGLAGADETGAYLVRDLPDLLDPIANDKTSPNPTKLYLKDVVARLQQPTDRGKRFLVILDVARPYALPALGMLRNDFDEKLQALIPELERTENLVILAPGAPLGLDPPPDPDGSSAFGHTLVAGLSGQATSLGGGRVNIESLITYLEAQLHVPPIALPSTSKRPQFTLAVAPRERENPLAIAPPDNPGDRSTAATTATRDDSEGPGDGTDSVAPTPATPWLEARLLEKTGPESYAPYLWRRYRETLLRVETLGRSLGSPTTTAGKVVLGNRDGLLRELTTLEQQIRVAQRIPLPQSGSSGLALPLASGVVPPAYDEPSPRFEAAWSPGTKPVAPVIVEAERIFFYDLLLARLESGLAADDATKIRRVLALLENRPRPRPFEAHLLAILMQDEHRPPQLFAQAGGSGLVGRALQVRRQAGRSHLGVAKQLKPASYPHVEQLAPLVTDRTDEGDRLRRDAEDALFLTEPKQWTDAQTQLNLASAAYEQAESQATDLREALIARDQALADLPYYADWVACHPEPRATEPLVSRLEAAWEATHQLADLLLPNLDRPALDLALAKLRTERQEIQRQFDGKVAKPFDDEVVISRIAPPLSTSPAHPTQSRDTAPPSDEDRQALARRRMTLLGLLQIPSLAIENRKTLENRLSEHLKKERSQLAKIGPSRSPKAESKDDPNAAARALTVRAAMTGRMALARLGQTYAESTINAQTSTRLGDRLADIQAGLKLLQQAFTAGPIGPDDLGHWAEQIGGAIRRVPVLIDQKVDHGLDLGVSVWPAELQASDHLARGLLAGQTLIRNPRRAATRALVEPTVTYRYRLVQRLLLAEAERTLDDHWFGENDDPSPDRPTNASPPYYWAVINLLLKDLTELDPAIPAPDLPETMVGRGAAVRPAERLTIIGPPGKLLPTDEPIFRPRYLIQGPVKPDGGVERGYLGRPSVWIDLNSTAGVVKRVGGAEERVSARRSLPINAPTATRLPEFGPESGEILDALLFPSSPGVKYEVPLSHKSGSFRTKGCYRGQLICQPTHFEAHAVPEIIVHDKPPPSTGSVTVLADPNLIARYGRVEEGALVLVLDCSGSMGARQNPPLKYREATAGVRQLLQRLARGTRLSVWVFGQAVGDAMTVPDAEVTIDQRIPPFFWDPIYLDYVMEKINSPDLKPWNNSPIVSAMIQASHDFASLRGTKSLVVLTDGKDDCFERFPGPMGEKRDITAALTSAFANTNIDISLVGYQVEGGDGEVENQFRALKLLRPPGRFVPVQRADQLADALRPTLRYEVQTLDNVVVDGVVERGNQPNGSPTFAKLAPGFYKLVVKADHWFERPLAIHAGDHLAVRLEEMGRQIQMTQLTQSMSLNVRSQPVDLDNWFLAILRNQHNSRTGLHLQASLERKADPRASALEEIRPQFVWMEVQRGQVASDLDFQQRWERVANSPVPTWEVTVPAWPDGPVPKTPAEPTLRASWGLQGRERPLEISVRGLINQLDLGHEQSLEVRTPRGAIRLRSLTIEDMPEARDGSKQLVVRLGHDPNRRVLARPVGLQVANQEHRLFTKAGRYTGRFGPLTGDQIRAALTGIEVITVDESIRRADSGGWMVDDLRAGVPTDDDLGPDRVLDGAPAVFAEGLEPLPAQVVPPR